MAADEPPYLTVGTDVSARYKGAFCEAKIKKVNRVVKCKVTFKNNQGSVLVPDDQIRGSLRIGALVEARHPEKNQYFDAIINKMQDYSQYTVVFDDGDETTLRRTSLCLKSGRHFAESPTLDQFPLTNPEHFSTPVIGVVKRKRRSTYNSAAIDYSSSDEEIIPKKTKSPRSREKTRDIGKVVCVDNGDRRKKDSWYPGLIVLTNSSQDTFKINPKDEYLIRSFKDGKYYQVLKKDTREFSREVSRKVESNTLKTAVDKAALYCEKGELPPHWDKALYLGLEAASGDDNMHDSDSDTSDDEPSEEKDRFVAQLYKFMDERGTPINKAPTVGNKDINLYKLFKVVHKMGGCNRVTSQDKWKIVYTKLGLQSPSSTGYNQLKAAYTRFLHSFENFNRKLGCTMVTHIRSTRGRHRSDRNFTPRNTVVTKVKSRAKDKSSEKKQPEDKTSPNEKKEVKNSKLDEKVRKKLDKPKEEKAKVKKEEEKPRLIRSQSLIKDKRDSPEDKKETRMDRARAREESKREKTESPEKKKETRSSAKLEQERGKRDRSASDNKSPEAKEIKDRLLKEKKESKLAADRKEGESQPKDRKVAEEKLRSWKTNKEDKAKVKNEDKSPEKEKSEEAKDKKSGNKSETDSPKHEAKMTREKRERILAKPEKDKVVLKTEKEDVDESKDLPIEKDTKEHEDVATKEKQKKSLKQEDNLMISEVKIEKLDVMDSEMNISQSSKTILMHGDDDDSNKEGLSKKLRGPDDGDDNKSFHDATESEDEDETGSEKSEKDGKERQIEIGDKVKVKYGRGRTRKVYEAKVLDVDTKGGERRFYVHYAGWNTRYDEWIKRSFIVENITERGKLARQQKQELLNKGIFPVAKKPTRPPGLAGVSKLIRKNSTSSTTSVSSSRTTRSDKNSLQTSPFTRGVQPKRRMRRKSGITTALTDTSQDSESDEDDMLFLYPDGDVNDEEDEPDTEVETSDKPSDNKDNLIYDQNKDHMPEASEESTTEKLMSEAKCEKIKESFVKMSEPVVALTRENIRILSLKDSNPMKPVDNEKRPSCILSTKSEIPERSKSPVGMSDTGTDSKLSAVGVSDSSKSTIPPPVSSTDESESVSKSICQHDATTVNLPKSESKMFELSTTKIIDSEIHVSPLKKQEVDLKKEDNTPRLSTHPILKAGVKSESKTPSIADNSTEHVKKDIFPRIDDKTKVSPGKSSSLFPESKPREKLPIKSNVVQHVGLFGDINFSTRSDTLGKSPLSKFSVKKTIQTSEVSSSKESADKGTTDNPLQSREKVVASCSKEKIFPSATNDIKDEKKVESNAHQAFTVNTVLTESASSNKIADCKSGIEKESPLANDKSNSSSSSNSSIPGLKEAIAGSIDENTSSSSIDFTDIFKGRNSLKQSPATSKPLDLQSNTLQTSFPTSKSPIEFTRPSLKLLENFSSVDKTNRKDEEKDKKNDVTKEIAVTKYEQIVEEKPTETEPLVSDEKDKENKILEAKDTGLQMSVITFIGSTSNFDGGENEPVVKMSEKSPGFECNNENTDDYELSALNEDTSMDEAKVSICENSSTKQDLSETKVTDNKLPAPSEDDNENNITGGEDSLDSKKLVFDDSIHESLTELSIDDESKEESDKHDRSFSSNNNSSASNVFLNVTADKTFKDAKDLFSPKKVVDAETKKDDINSKSSSESSKPPSSPDKSTDDVMSSDKTVSNKDSEDNVSSSSLTVSKKESKKKKSKFGKKTLGMDSSEKDDLKKGKSKKRRTGDGDEASKSKDFEQKSKTKKMKKNKNKKRFVKHDDHNFNLSYIEDREEISEKIKRKRKREDKKFSKFDLKAEGTSGEPPSKKERKKGRKNKANSDRKMEPGEKKVKKKKKIHSDNIAVDSDSEKDSMIRLGEKKKKKEKKKVKSRDSSSSDDATGGKLLIDEAKGYSEREERNNDPDMSFLLCEEKVPASPVNAGPDDTTASSSIDDSNNVSPSSDEEPAQVVDLEMYSRSANLGLLGSVNKHSDTCAVLDNTPPTTPSSTESIPSSSPSHDREPFVHYTESTQSGRDSGDGESDSFPCRSEVTESEEYRAAATLAFAVCKSVPEKQRDCSPRVPLKRQKSESEDCTPSKRRKKPKRSFSQQDTPTKPRIKGNFRYSKGDSFDAFDSSETYPMGISAMSHGHASAICSSFSHSSNQQSSHLSEVQSCKSNKNIIYLPLQDCKDPEKRISILQDKMSELKKAYAAFKAEVATIDRRRKKARKKLRESTGSTANNLSIQPEDGQNCS